MNSQSPKPTAQRPRMPKHESRQVNFRTPVPTYLCLVEAAYKSNQTLTSLIETAALNAAKKILEGGDEK